MSPEVAQRSRHLSELLAARRAHTWLDRATVLDECESTQDEAFAAASGEAGILVTAIRQTRGRGRQGRPWVQKASLGLAATFVLDADAHEMAFLSLRIACAICRMCMGMPAFAPRVAGRQPPFVSIKWPNDIVVAGPPFRNAAYRKLAGVLIERRDRLLLVGIGINLLQQSEDWPETLQGQAVSLAMLGAAPTHEAILSNLIDALDHFLFVDQQEVRDTFARHDVLTGTRQVFEHDRQRYEGKVERIDPIDGIRLTQKDGTSVTLPAMTSTLVHHLDRGDAGSD